MVGWQRQESQVAGAQGTSSKFGTPKKGSTKRTLATTAAVTACLRVTRPWQRQARSHLENDVPLASKIKNDIISYERQARSHLENDVPLACKIKNGYHIIRHERVDSNLRTILYTTRQRLPKLFLGRKGYHIRAPRTCRLGSSQQKLNAACQGNGNTSHVSVKSYEVMNTNEKSCIRTIIRKCKIPQTSAIEVVSHTACTDEFR